MAKIRVGTIGVGNCFAGLYQGIAYYRKNRGRKVAGLMHEKMAGYSWGDLEFVSAFDVGKNKIGKPLADALYEAPNMVDWLKKSELPECKTVVREAPVLDGVGIYVENKILPVKNKPIEQLRKEIINELENTKTTVLVNYLPVGSQKAVEWWAEIALETGCAFVNSMPVFIASEPRWERKFSGANLPVVGDDFKSQVGATIVHRSMARLCTDRGAEITKTYQINVGGNSVAGDEMITLLVDGRVIHTKIGEFIDNLIERHGSMRGDGKETVLGTDLPETIECLTIDDNYELKITIVDAFVRHAINEPLFELETEEGRRVKITKDHNVFILNDTGTLEPILVKDLKEDESLIAVPASLSIPQREKKAVDLTPYLKELHAEGVEGGFLKIHNHPEMRIPVQFPVSDAFLQLAGLWLADGSFDRDGSANIELACGNEPECIQLVEGFCESLNINYVSRGPGGISLRLMSKTLANICKTCLGFRGDSYTKQAPAWVFELSDRQIAQVLKGYVSGDGGISGDQARWSSVSKQLIEDVRTLLLRIGIGSTAFMEKYGKNRSHAAFPSTVGHCWHGLITAQPDLERFAEKVGFLQPEKNSRLIEVLSSKAKVDTTRRVPNLGMLRQAWRIKSTTWYRNPTIEAGIVLSQLDKIKDSALRERIRRVCEGDVKFLKIKRIRRLPEHSETRVYDLSVKPCERFICSNILVHNTDFLNMKEQKRLMSKKISKTESVQSQLAERLPDDKIYIGPSDFIPFLGNTKLAFIRLEGEMWAGRPFSLEMRLEVDDKANSSGVAIDAIRCAQIALDRKIGGAILPACAYLMKHPPKQYPDAEGKALLEKFIKGE